MSDFSLRFDMSEVLDFAEALEALDGKVLQRLRQGLQAAGNYAEMQITSRTPVDQGDLRGSIGVTFDIFGGGVRLEVGTPLEYGIVIEEGRTAGRTWPPRDAIRGWVQRKLGLSGREADSVAFLIQRKIGVQGTEGTHMFAEGLAASESFFYDQMGRVRDEITGGRLL